MNPSSYFGGLYNKPFKIFVTARENDAYSFGAGPSTQKHQLNLPDSKSAYEEVLTTIPETTTTPDNAATVPKKPKDSPRKLQLFNKSLFLKSCQENDVKTISEMDLSNKSNLNTLDDFGWSGLMIAACANAVDAFSLLLSLDIDFERTDKSGRSALDLAQKKGYEGIVDAFSHFIHEQRLQREANQEEEPQDGESRTAFHCDLCGVDFSETSQESHLTSVLHQFNNSQGSSTSHRLNYGISTKNPGYQLMLKQGWNTRGLGPTEEGRLYPVKTVLRKGRSGLGTKQSEPGRVTHFQANDASAVKYRPQEKAKGRREMSLEYESNKRKERRLRKALS